MGNETSVIDIFKVDDRNDPAPEPYIEPEVQAPQFDRATGMPILELTGTVLERVTD